MRKKKQQQQNNNNNNYWIFIINSDINVSSTADNSFNSQFYFVF